MSKTFSRVSGARPGQLNSIGLKSPAATAMGTGDDSAILAEVDVGVASIIVVANGG